MGSEREATTPPPGWTRSDLGTLGRWLSGGTPSMAKAEFWAGSTPWCSPKDMKRFVLLDTEDHVSDSAAGNGTRIVPAGSVFIVVRGMILAHTFPVCVAGRPMAFNQDVKAIVPAGNTDGRFVAHWLCGRSDALLRLVTESTHGTKRLQQSELQAFSLDLPPLPEQRQISAVLDTVDNTIQKTEEIIAKLKQVKQGLLHDLLTRGIDENGELRDPERHPELFKDSVLGRIPREWEAHGLREVLDRIDAGWSPACVEVPPSGGAWGVLKVSAISSGVFLPVESKTLPAHLNPRPELEVREGDVVLARANGVAQLVGVTAEATDVPPRLMLSDKLLRLVARPELLLNSFLAYTMKGTSIRGQIAQIISGSSGQKNLSQAQIHRLAAALPHTYEQARIVAVLRGLANRENRELKQLTKLRLLKSALMDDLLTGRVRTTALLATDAR